MINKKESRIIIIFDSIISLNRGKVEYKHLFDDLNFKDEVFHFMRSCYEKRSDNANYHRLTFLIIDAAIHPKNEIVAEKNNITVGWRINLGSSSEPNAKPIITQGLEEIFGNASYQTLLERIWYWTSGHPFLTQKLFQLLLTNVFDESTPTKGREEDYVDKLVERVKIDWERENREKIV